MATLTENRTDDVTRVSLIGGLTFEGVGPVSKPFEAATSGGAVIVDMAGVPVVTTPGLSLLLLALKRMQHHGGHMVLTGLTDNVRELLRRCRLDRVFTIAQDEAAAREFFQAAAARPQPA